MGKGMRDRVIEKWRKSLAKSEVDLLLVLFFLIKVS